MEENRFIDLVKAADFLKQRDNFVILTHQNPDGDTLGSGFGLAMLLDKMGKKSTVICSDEIPKKYAYFTNLAPQNADFNEAITVVAVDVADTKLLGKLEKEYASKVELCIDHHISNIGYAVATYLDSNAAANCECVYDLAKALSVDVDKNMAISVPMVIILPAYRLAAAAENPHCGNAPSKLPITGPNLPDF